MSNKFYMMMKRFNIRVANREMKIYKFDIQQKLHYKHKH